MKRLALVLGCYGLMVGPAEAGERWPEGPCADVASLRTILEKGPGTAPNKAQTRLGVLLLQREHCGVSVKAELAADLRTYERAISASEARTARNTRAASPAPQEPGPLQPMNCTTIKLDDDLSTTNCF